MIIQALFIHDAANVNYFFASGTIWISKYPINCVCPFFKERGDKSSAATREFLLRVGGNSVGHSAGFLSLLHIPFVAAGLSGYPDVYCICLKL